jgi:hypothetical protein
LHPNPEGKYTQRKIIGCNEKQNYVNTTKNFATYENGSKNEKVGH